VDYAGGEAGALRHWDDRRYTFEVPADARGSVTVRVRARYQVTTREYVEFLAAENRTDARGRDLLARYNATGRAAPFTMVEASTRITVGAPVADAGTAADAGRASDTGSAVDAGRAMDAGTTPPPAGGCGCRTTAPRGGAWGAWGAVLVLGMVLARRRRRGDATAFPRGG
jgi:MYXO-CTERM domain-containing protein